jgi:Cu/Ag efflux protein CusF
MRKTLIPIAAVALMASSFGAFAADSVTTGVIKSLDATAMTMTLEDGTVFTLPAGFQEGTLKVGEKVTIDWKLANSKHMADTVTPAKS